MAKQVEAKQVEAKQVDFVNPFDDGINYDVFLKACDGNVKEYCEGKLTPEQIEWLENDLTYYKK